MADWKPIYFVGAVQGKFSGGKMAKSVFSKMVSGEIKFAKIYEDDLTLAFLDHNPLTVGHTLVIPKRQIDRLEDCPEDLYHAVFATVHKVSNTLLTKLAPLRIGLVVHGLDIRHAHVHLVPLYTGKELHLADRDHPKPNHEELAALAKKLYTP